MCAGVSIKFDLMIPNFWQMNTITKSFNDGQKWCIKSQVEIYLFLLSEISLSCSNSDLSICTANNFRAYGMPMLFMCACVKFSICRSPNSATRKRLTIVVVRTQHYVLPSQKHRANWKHLNNQRPNIAWLQVFDSSRWNRN